MTNKKFYGRRYLGSASNLDFLTLPEIIEYFTNEFKGLPPTARIDVSTYDGTADMLIKWERPPTPQELENEAITERQRQQYRKEQYEALKKEFDA